MLIFSISYSLSSLDIAESKLNILIGQSITGTVLTAYYNHVAKWYRFLARNLSAILIYDHLVKPFDSAYVGVENGSVNLVVAARGFLLERFTRG